MPTPPYAKLRISVNGGAVQTGAVVVNPGDVLAFTAESTVGWSSAPQWQIYSYPPGYTAPAGWSTDGSGVIFSTATTPPNITAPAIALWGKFMMRLIVNNSSVDPITGAGTPTQLVDSATAWEIVSANGLHDLADLEGNQFGADWTAQQRTNLRTLDTAINGSGGSAVVDYDGRAHSLWGGGTSPTLPKATIDSVRAFLATTDATANQVVDTYQLALNSAAWLSCLVVAKLSGSAGTAFWRVADGLVERFGAGAAAIKLAPAITLVGAYDGLSTMTAGAVTFALSATTGAVDVRFTGLAATNISVSAFRQAPQGAQ